MTDKADTPEKKKSSGFLPTVIAILVIIAIGVAVWWFFFRTKAAAPVRPAVVVSTAEAVREDAPLQVSALGTVTSTYTTTIHSRVDGELIRLHFEEGEYVKAGQLLAELDPRPFQADLKQAEGQLMRDRALLENARLDLKRYRILLEQNSIAKQQVDTQASLVRQYEGTVRLDEGNVDNARLQLEYTRIAAPISGRVGLRQVDLGNIVHTTDTDGIVTITQEQPINVVFSIPEVNLVEVLRAYSVNKQLKVTAWNRENNTQLAEGTLLAIDNQLNTDTGAIGMKAKFENTGRELFPNQFVNVRLHLGVQPDAVVIPTVAIQLGRQDHTVYRVNSDNTVSLVKIKPGAVSGINTIIEEGLEPGDVVVIDGVDRLRDGSKIRIAGKESKQDKTSAGGQPSDANAKEAPEKSGEKPAEAAPAGEKQPDSGKPAENKAAAPAPADAKALETAAPAADSKAPAETKEPETEKTAATAPAADAEKPAAAEKAPAPDSKQKEAAETKPAAPAKN